MRSLARDAGLTERYVGKVFRCAFLAPDIVEAILAGRQPHDLNFHKLCHDIPLSWVEQREQLGFSPARTHGPCTSPGIDPGFGSSASARSFAARIADN